jgi:hypothetical protein
VPTHEQLEGWYRDYKTLSADERAQFRVAVVKFLEDLSIGKFRLGLRVKGVQSTPGIFEMTWAMDGRATFHYGPEKFPGSPHIVWRRIGSHAILDRP